MKSVQIQNNEQLASRDRSPLARAVVWFVIWWLARLPVAVPDFHEVDHHHDHGQQCLYHEHLSRWHEAAETRADEHDAVLHWHWLIPGEGAGDFGREQPGESPDPTKSAQIVHWIAPASNQSDVFESFINAGVYPEKTWVCTASAGDSEFQIWRGSLAAAVFASKINPYFCFDPHLNESAGSTGQEEPALLSRPNSKPLRC